MSIEISDEERIGFLVTIISGFVSESHSEYTSDELDKIIKTSNQLLDKVLAISDTTPLNIEDMDFAQKIKAVEKKSEDERKKQKSKK